MTFRSRIEMLENFGNCCHHRIALFSLMACPVTDLVHRIVVWTPSPYHCKSVTLVILSHAMSTLYHWRTRLDGNMTTIGVQLWVNVRVSAFYTASRIYRRYPIFRAKFAQLIDLLTIGTQGHSCSIVLHAVEFPSQAAKLWPPNDRQKCLLFILLHGKWQFNGLSL